MKRILVIFHLLLILQSVYPIEIFVSVETGRKQDGSIKFPFSSVEKAQRFARSYVGKEKVTVTLLDGFFYLDKTISFTAEDNGTKEFPVVYRANHKGGSNTKWRSIARCEMAYI